MLKIRTCAVWSTFFFPLRNMMWAAVISGWWDSRWFFSPFSRSLFIKDLLCAGIPEEAKWQKYSSGRQKRGSWFQFSHSPAVNRAIEGETEPDELALEPSHQVSWDLPNVRVPSRHPIRTCLPRATPHPYQRLGPLTKDYPSSTSAVAGQLKLEEPSWVMWGGKSIFAYKQSIFLKK